MTAANREAAGRNERPLPPFPAKQMFVLGTELSLHDFCDTGSNNWQPAAEYANRSPSCPSSPTFTT